MNHLPGKLEDSASLTRLDTEVGARGNRDEVALFPPEPTVWLQLLLLLPELELLLAALPVEMCRPWARLAMAVNVSSKPVMSEGGGEDRHARMRLEYKLPLSIKKKEGAIARGHSLTKCSNMKKKNGGKLQAKSNGNMGHFCLSPFNV